MKQLEAPRLFAPGPTYVPEYIRQAMALPIFHHRSPEFKAVVGEVHQMLRRTFHTPEWDPLIFACSGTGTMEGAVANFMKRGAKAITVSAGKFGERWARILEAFGCEPVELRLEWGRSVDPDDVLRLLDQHPDVRAVYLTSADTSTGGEHPIQVLGPAIREKSEALVVVDSICDFAGGRDLRPVEWQVDVVVSASQKCLMVPPGLGMATVAPRAWEFSDTADLPRFYFDWRAERKKMRLSTTAYTSACNLIMGLHASLTMIEEEGLDNVIARHARFAHAVRTAMRAIGLELLPEIPTNGLTAIKCPAGMDGTQVYQHVQEKYGYRIANGQNQLKGKLLRLGHMGKLSECDILGLIHVVQSALVDLDFGPAEGDCAVAVAEKALAGLNDRSRSFPHKLQTAEM